MIFRPIGAICFTKHNGMAPGNTAICFRRRDKSRLYKDFYPFTLLPFYLSRRDKMPMKDWA